jgi:hypothetical protein
MLPKVLLINYLPINNQCAVGFTLSNLFKGWPKDRIAQIYIYDAELDRSVCERSYQLDFCDLRINLPLKLFLASRFSRRSHRQSALGKASPGVGIEPLVSSGDLQNVKRHWSPFNVLKSIVIWFVELYSYRITREMDEWIRDFEPEVVYSYLESAHVVSLVKDISAKYQIPVVPHFFDDWVTVPMMRPEHKGILSKRLLKNTYLIMKKAPCRLVVGEAMGREYSQRYSLAFHSFMNCVDPQQRLEYRSSGGTRRRMRFAYVGGLHLNRFYQLMELADALVCLRKEKLFGEIVIAKYSRIHALDLPLREKKNCLSQRMHPSTPLFMLTILIHTQGPL